MTGSSGAVIAAAYLIRAAGDVGDGSFSWASPLGWAQKVRSFAGEQWWPLLLSLGTAAALVVVAAYLIERRDVGAGLVAPRPGPPTATGWLGTPLGLAWRLQRATVLWWALGVFLGGVAYGSVAESIDEFIQDNETMREMVAAAGGDVLDSFFATTLLMLAIGTGGYAIQATLRLRSEETATRAELVLSTPVSRQAWVGSHLAIALAGSAFVVAAGGFGLGVTYAAVAGDAAQILRLTVASLAYVPAVWALVGGAALLFGVAPKASLFAWGALAAVFVLGFFGTVLKLPKWVLGLSPFDHIPQVPAEPATVAPIAIVTAVAAALVAVGVVTFRRRDVA